MVTESLTITASGLVATVAVAWTALLWSYRETLARAWREPVLRFPVLVVESDDWGPGPEADADSLGAVRRILQSHSDGRGRHPVMTLGMVLGTADPSACRTGRYGRVTLDAPMFEPIRAAITQGCDAGVFSVQLHGLEHFWPPAVQARARTEPEVRRWLEQEGIPDAQQLPSELQSRWVDARGLPSTPLPADEIAGAARSEAQLFARIFSRPPAVAVPPTFVWTRAVESAWAEQGVRAVVTPGVRHTCRDAQGRPGCTQGPLANGARGGGVVFVVRDIYFEPALGHTPEAALGAARTRFALGRPALLETHRFNFVGDTAASALESLDRLLASAPQALPGLHFMGTEELADAYRNSDPGLFETRLVSRLHVTLRRLLAIGRLRKLAWLTGLALPVTAVLWLTARGAIAGDPLTTGEAEP